jgi:hypothetical protein
MADEIKIFIQDSQVEVYPEEHDVALTTYSGLPGITNLSADSPITYDSSTQTVGISGLGTASTRDVPSSGDAAADQVVLGNDSRLVAEETALQLPFGVVTDVANHYLVSMGSNVVNQIIPEGIIFYCPIWLSNSANVDRIAVEVATSASQSGVVRLGIYEADANGLPGSLIVDAGTVDSSTVGVKQAIISEQLIGLKWLAVVSQNNISSLKCFTQIQQAYPSPTTGSVSAGKLSLSSPVNVFATLPDPAPAPFEGITYYPPIVNLRLSA